MRNIKIREYRNSDLGPIVSLLGELNEFTASSHELNEKTVSRIFQEMTKYPEIYKNSVVEFGTIIIGFLSIVLYKTPFHAGGTALINELIVKSEHRGKGIGKLLIDKAKEIAKNNAMDELEVGTEKSNISAQHFYKKCGFTNEFILFGLDFD